MSGDGCFVKLENVSLAYDLHYDRTNTLKESFVNFLTRRKYVEKTAEKLYALKDITLEVKNGQRLGIIGLNGSGKSTLLKVVSRLLTPTNGEVQVRGTVQPLIEMGAGFNFECSGRENIYLNGAILGFRKKTIMEHEEEIIRFSELDEFIDMPVKYYSSGMILRLAFTIATLVRPEILVLDEMISAGDIEFVHKAKDRIDKLLKRAKILLLVSHDLALVQSLTTRVIVLDKGKMLFDGDPREATEFYLELVSGNLDRKQHQASEEREDVHGQEVASEDEPSSERPIRIRSVSHSGQEGQQGLIMPNETVTYVVKFETHATFERIFVNLVIMDRLGVWVAHLRNDAFEIVWNDLPGGLYLLELSLCDIPFQTGHYTYFFRVVATTRQGQVLHICDSEHYKFEIGGNKSEHTLFKCRWNLIEEAKFKGNHNG
jgi:ABC-type polysaccharide/polyol phosphate transport system ATPase subunit